jgi:hypothetical protein
MVAVPKNRPSSPREYLALEQDAQDRPRIEAYTRQPDGEWRHQAASGPDAVLRLEALDCELRLADIYVGITFAEPPSDTNPNSEGPRLPGA